MFLLLSTLWADDQGYEVADYALTLAVILVILAGTLRVIHSDANVIFWSAQ
jgi:hypothetical protein